MAELKPYVEGQQIEPIKPRVYTTIEEQAELKAYREFGNLSQLRVLCDNYHELLNELRNRPTEAEIRARAIDEFAEKLREFCKTHEVSADKVRQLVYKRDGEWQWYDLIKDLAEQLKEE